MKLLLDSRKLILAIDEVIEFGTFEDEQKWKIGNMYFIDNDYISVQVESIPIEIIPYKYFYIEEEYVLNPNWSNTPEEIQKVNNRINEVLLKKAESELDIDERLSKLELGLV